HGVLVPDHTGRPEPSRLQASKLPLWLWALLLGRVAWLLGYAHLAPGFGGRTICFISTGSNFVLADPLTTCNNSCMIIGDRLRALREEKKLSQGDIEKRTGLLRCYISRVENGHTVPAIETLEKMARALECP